MSRVRVVYLGHEPVVKEYAGKAWLFNPHKDSPKAGTYAIAEDQHPTTGVWSGIPKAVKIADRPGPNWCDVPEAMVKILQAGDMTKLYAIKPGKSPFEVESVMLEQHDAERDALVRENEKQRKDFEAAQAKLEAEYKGEKQAMASQIEELKQQLAKQQQPVKK